MNENKRIRILHFSPHDEDCGIGKYQEHYFAGMADEQHLQNTFFAVSPMVTMHMGSEELDKVLADLRQQLKDFDILHIQHDFSLYSGNEFKRVVEIGKDEGKKVVVTEHASPKFFIKKPKLTGLGPHSIVHYLRQQRYRERLMNNHVEPLGMADLVIAHDDSTVSGLKELGINPGKIAKLTHPVYEFKTPPKSEVITKHLRTSKDDIIYCTTGFMHKHKGLPQAIKALKYLPENYKLAIIGGIHPTSDDVPIYDRICDLIDTLGLQNRVYITGYVKDDDQMNAYIKECDVCVYPYDRVYYSNVSSGALNLAFANDMPVIGYPTNTFIETSELSEGALVVCGTFAYYELARELQRIDLKKQSALSTAYAKKMAWPKMAKHLVAIYEQVMSY